MVQRMHTQRSFSFFFSSQHRLICDKQVRKVSHMFQICVAHICFKIPNVIVEGYKYACCINTDVENMYLARTFHTESHFLEGAAIVGYYCVRKSTFTFSVHFSSVRQTILNVFISLFCTLLQVRVVIIAAQQARILLCASKWRVIQVC